MAFRFQTRIRHVTLSWSPFSAETMSSIGQVWLDTKLARIRSAIDSTDAPAKPLVDRYARRKGLHGRGLGRVPIRNWTFRDVTLKAAKVKVASEDRVTIGLISTQANQIISAQRRLCEMWLPSPNEIAALHAVVRASLRTHTARILRQAFKKTA